jgi:hypothetical protein
MWRCTCARVNATLRTEPVNVASGTGDSEMEKDRGSESGREREREMLESRQVYLRAEASRTVSCRVTDPTLRDSQPARDGECQEICDLVRECRIIPIILLDLSAPSLSLSGFSFLFFFCLTLWPARKRPTSLL